MERPDIAVSPDIRDRRRCGHPACARFPSRVRAGSRRAGRRRPVAPRRGKRESAATGVASGATNSASAGQYASHMKAGLAVVLPGDHRDAVRARGRTRGRAHRRCNGRSRCSARRATTSIMPPVRRAVADRTRGLRSGPQLVEAADQQPVALRRVGAGMVGSACACRGSRCVAARRDTSSGRARPSPPPPAPGRCPRRWRPGPPAAPTRCRAATAGPGRDGRRGAGSSCRSGRTWRWTAAVTAAVVEPDRRPAGRRPGPADRRAASAPDGRGGRRRAAAPVPAQLPDDIAQAALWLPPPVKPPQISSRVAASPAAYRPGTSVAQSSSAIRMPPVPRTVPSASRVIAKRSVNGSIPSRSKAGRSSAGPGASRACSARWPGRSAQNTGSSASVRAMTERPPGAARALDGACRRRGRTWPSE